MERHPNRESVIELYLRDHLGTVKVRISENPSTLGIVFCIDDERGRLQHRLVSAAREHPQLLRSARVAAVVAVSGHFPPSFASPTGSMRHARPRERRHVRKV